MSNLNQEPRLYALKIKYRKGPMKVFGPEIKVLGVMDYVRQLNPEIHEPAYTGEDKKALEEQSKRIWASSAHPLIVILMAIKDKGVIKRRREEHQISGQSFWS